MMGISDCNMVATEQGCFDVNDRAAALEQLFVIHRSSSIVLFTHHFKVTCQTNHPRGKGVVVRAWHAMLLHSCYDNHMDETVFRLERFATDFETQFAAKLVGRFNIDMNEYTMATSLVERNVMA